MVEIWVESVKYTTRGGALVTYKTDGEPPAKAGTKKAITEFSDVSRKKLAYTASNSHLKWQSMITLTYCRNYPKDGEIIKRQLNSFLTYTRKLIPGVKYLWFLEFQKRGAPHYHILLSSPYNEVISERLALSWVNIATIEGDKADFKYLRFILWFNSTARKVKNIEGCQFWQDAKSADGLSHYAVKYASKLEQKTCPNNYLNVGRFWGSSRNLIVYDNEVQYGRYAKQPYASDIFPDKPLTGLPKYVFGD